ncbi:MAG TPA: hypothetical protein PLK99_03400, partial [Burkholderiales bacterium]|nr:hypothetical protein [Burkholderiales bacterium]
IGVFAADAVFRHYIGHDPSSMAKTIILAAVLPMRFIFDFPLPTENYFGYDMAFIENPGAR